MHAFSVVALLLISIVPAAAAADAQTDAADAAETAVSDCFDSHQGEGGNLPSARLTGGEKYIYIPASMAALDSAAASGDGKGGGEGTYITWGSGCLGDGTLAIL